MKRIIPILLLFVLISSVGNAQDILLDIAKNTAKKKAPRTRNLFSVGLSYGVDKNFNAFRATANKFGNDFHNDKLYTNATLDLGIYASKKLRFRVESKYVRMGYKADWKNADFPTIKETVVDLYNFAGCFHIDYNVTSIKKLDLSLSAGFKWEFTSDYKFYNKRTDGTTDEGDYYNIINEYPSDIYGATLSGILKYNITKHIGITMTPEYTFFFDKFVPTNDKYYQRFSLNAGLEFAF